MTRSISTRAAFTLVVGFFVAGCGGTAVTTTTPPVARDPRLAVVNVDVAPMLSELSRYPRGPRHSYYRPAREAGQQVAVEIGGLGASTDIDPLTGPDGFRIIGSIENKDLRFTELTYGLKPGTRYLIWIAPGPVNSTNNSRTRWGLLEYPRVTRGVFPSAPVGYVLWCQNYDQPSGRPSDVDLRDPATCNVNVSGVPRSPFQLASVTEPESAVPEYSAQAGRGTVWLQCATGGCFASNRF
ncbi:MAG TPA: hypothetical protein VNO75_01070 [Gemmatimonadaceae bacterium]|nr:hypothetical protein [Gemmatimonadaceae bacterium]